MIFTTVFGCDFVERSKKDSISNSIGKKENNLKITDSTVASTPTDSIVNTTDQESMVNKEIDDTTFVSILDIEKEFDYVDMLKLNNGIKIKWIERKRGRTLQDGEMILLEYRLGLPDGKIIDGNNKMKMPHLPFVIGYNMQQKGWDLALSQLCVGDVAKIEIPSALAYGKKGLGTVIPPNTDNWLFVKIHGMVGADFDKGGMRYWELRSGEENNNAPSKVKFHMIASTKSKANIFNTYASNFPLTYALGQKNYPKGLEEVLKKAKKDQHLFLILNPEMAYGDKGYTDLVRPNESVFYNLKIIDVE